MVDPRFDINRIPKDILKFLKYTQSGHEADASIQLAIVQLFENVRWDDILIGQDMIEQLITTYESPNGVDSEVMLGKGVNFVLGTYYVQYHLAQPNAKPPST